jgi:hypothetical protein
MSTMKRLFMLRHSKGGSVVLGSDKLPVYFDNKPDAKAARNHLGGETVVSHGPDHKLFKGAK